MRRSYHDAMPELHTSLPDESRAQTVLPLNLRMPRKPILLLLAYQESGDCCYVCMETQHIYTFRSTVSNSAVRAQQPLHPRLCRHTATPPGLVNRHTPQAQHEASQALPSKQGPSDSKHDNPHCVCMWTCAASTQKPSHPQGITLPMLA